MSEADFDEMRRAMVASQLRTTGVNDARVLAAMGAVAREAFLPEERRSGAYADALLPLGEGRAMSPPMALGLLLTEARLSGAERALVIGAATGYAAAVTAKLVADVVALEEAAPLAEAARRLLADFGVRVVEGPLNAGHAAAAPYDFILIDGAVEEIPQAIIDQVADGGRIAFALLERGISRLSIGRVAGDGFGITSFADAAAAPLPGFARSRAFSFS